ncbi:MAG: EAL domain-containing protein [Thermaerobacter sp.]|nr:EAL domain-containing protein [Thermaerobacter sp.]
MITAAQIRQTMRLSALQTAFQPLWDLRRGRVFGYEALARFPAHNSLRWFQAARRHGLELSLNRFACGRAIADFAPLAAALPQALLFLNASSPASAVEIGRIAQRSPYADRIVIELKEGLVAQAEDLVYVVEELRRGGLRLAVDDMGSGPSDRHCFDLLAPEVLKVDRQIVARCMAGQRAAEAQLAEYVELAEAAGCYVLAEGIERQDWLEALAVRGVALAQGFAVGRPAGAAENLAAVRTRSPLPRARLAAPAAATLPDVLGRGVRRYIQENRQNLVGAVAPNRSQETASPRLLRALLPVLDYGTRPDAWHYGVSPEFARHIAAIDAQSVEIAQGFSHLRGYLVHRFAPEAKGEVHEVINRIGDWLDALEIAVLRQHERVVVQQQAFREEELARRSRQTTILRELLTNLGEGRLDAMVPQRAAQLVGADEAALVLTSLDGKVRDMITHPLGGEAVREATAAWLHRSPQTATQAQHRVAGGMRRLQGPFSSMISMPVAFDGERIGVLVAWRREPVGFLQRDSDALTLLVGQIAAAVHAHARLGEVVRREHELLALEEMATALRTSESAAEAARELLEGLRRLFSAEVHFVAACDLAEGTAVLPLSAYPPSAASLAHLGIQAGTQWVAEHGEPLFLREGALALEGEGANRGLRGFRSVAVAPIMAGSRVLGAVGALDRRDRHIEARCVETLERAAALFSLVQARFEREEGQLLAER